MSIHRRIARAKRWPQALMGLTAVLGAFSACATIVGIDDTTVTRGDGSTGGSGNSSGSTSRAGAAQGGTAQGGAAQAGAAQAGAAQAGAAQAGAAQAGAAQAGAAQAGATSNAGHSNGGGSLGGAAASAGAAASGAGGTAGIGGGVSQAGNGGSAVASECPCSAPKPTCDNGKCVVRGPTMAKATSYYIDSTEVSKAQYDVFLTAKGADTSGQVAECSWNQSYAAGGAAVDDPRPIVNVDWCDAAAYCTWADKRLCGAIGGGPLAAADLNSPTKAQWYLACAGADNERYPYGGFSLEPDYCNEYFSGNMADVGQFTKCEGHYAGVFDLVGNAAEWIDSCDTAGGTDRSLDNCQLSGGSYINNQYTCQTYFDSVRNDTAAVFGFRCCSK